MDKKELRMLVESLFSKRGSLNSLWQEQAEHFYPERADFTYKRSLGKDFAEDLMTSYPLVARRELAQQIGVMLRPTEQDWFYMKPQDEDRETHNAKAWLERAAKVQRRAMYDRVAMFTRAASEADHDYSTFGQYVMSVRLNRNQNALLYRVWHLRDVVWLEDEECRIVLVARKWKPTKRDLIRTFGERTHPEVRKAKGRQVLDNVECLHIMLDADMWDENAAGRPWFSIHMDCDHGEGHVMESVSQWNREYIISRWQTVSGSQYAYSPATVAALPDARLIQSMTYTLLEAGEKSVNPPMLATTEAVKSTVEIYTGGLTWVDRDYDERLGAALRPLNQEYRGLPYGMEMLQDVRGLIHTAFFLNKLTLPQRAPEMTAYEIGQRVQEYIRGALPLFEPMEAESNGQMCEVTFDLLLRAGAFGSPFDMPQELRGAEVDFGYRSPLHEAMEAAKATTFQQGAQLLASAMALDESVAVIPDSVTALRDSLDGIGWPTEWVNSEDEVRQMMEQQKQQQQTAQMLQSMESGSKSAQQMGAAQKASAEAEAMAAAGVA